MSINKRPCARLSFVDTVSTVTTTTTSIIIIVVGNGISDLTSNPERD